MIFLLLACAAPVTVAPTTYTVDFHPVDAVSCAASQYRMAAGACTPEEEAVLPKDLLWRPAVGTAPCWSVAHAKDCCAASGARFVGWRDAGKVRDGNSHIPTVRALCESR